MLPSWLQGDYARAKYIVQNMPDQKDLVKAVQDMNIPAGKEFGQLRTA